MTGPFRTTTRLRPGDGSCRCLGNVCAGNGEYDRAIQDYNQALRRDPNHVATYYNRGDVYAAKGVYEQANE